MSASFFVMRAFHLQLLAHPCSLRRRRLRGHATLLQEAPVPNDERAAPARAEGCRRRAGTAPWPRAAHGAMADAVYLAARRFLASGRSAGAGASVRGAAYPVSCSAAAQEWAMRRPLSRSLRCASRRPSPRPIARGGVTSRPSSASLRLGLLGRWAHGARAGCGPWGRRAAGTAAGSLAFCF